MFGKIAGTLGSKMLLALMNFLVVTLTSNNLGSEGFGYISLIILGITMVQMVNNFVGGPALVYLIPRFSFLKLFVPSYLWAVLSAIIVTAVLYIFNLIPRQFGFHIFCLSVIASFNSINQMVMLGKERINLYNLVTMIQLSFMLFSLALFFLLFDKRDIEAYIISLYIQFGSGAILGYLIIRKDFNKAQSLESKGVLKEIFKYGSLTQTANIIQFLNYRLGYYIIDTFSGKAVLGVFNVGVQLAEGLWLIGKSLALIQYSRLSNNKDLEYAKEFSIRLLKISVLSTLFAILIMFVIPSPVFTYIFGSEFFLVKKVFIYLSPGIISIAACLIFSHYLSGLGKVQINTVGSFIGLLITLGAGFLLIPEWGLTGAAITASASYFFMMVFQFIMFMHISKARFSELLITKTDIALIIDKTRAILASLKKIK